MHASLILMLLRHAMIRHREQEGSREGAGRSREQGEREQGGSRST